MKLTITIGGIAAVLLAGCGGFGSTATAATAKTSPSPRAGRGAFGGGVAGQVAQTGAGKLVVTSQSGSVTVTYDSSTSVLQSGNGSLADLAPGTCVVVNGDKDASGAVTATAVQAMLNMNGVCSAPAGGGPGRGPSPGVSPRPGGFPSANPNAALVRGKVATASGSTIAVQDTTGVMVTVTVPGTARITRTVSSTAARLAVGECVTVNGQRSSSGTVQARTIVISAPGPNGCTSGGGFGGGRREASPGPGQTT